MSEKINIQAILQKLEMFQVENLNFKEDKLALQIKLTKEQNAHEQEQIICALLPEYQLQITFIMKDESIKPFKKIIGISSGKGGVGKSTISLHIAFALKEMGYKVGILDADIYAPSIPAFLNVFDNPISSDGRHIDPIETEHGFQLLSMGLFLQSNQSTLWRGPMLATAFNQFLEQGKWNCDYLIIDLPPGTSDIHMSLAKIAPQTQILLVTEPSKIAYVDVKRMYITCRALNLNVLGLIENRSYSICKKCGNEEFYKTQSKIEETNIIAQLPIFMHFHDLAESGYDKSYKMQAEKTAFEEIAKKLI